MRDRKFILVSIVLLLVALLLFYLIPFGVGPFGALLFALTNRWGCVPSQSVSEQRSEIIADITGLTTFFAVCAAISAGFYAKRTFEEQAEAHKLNEEKHKRDKVNDAPIIAIIDFDVVLNGVMDEPSAQMKYRLQNVGKRFAANPRIFLQIGDNRSELFQTSWIGSNKAVAKSIDLSFRSPGDGPNVTFATFRRAYFSNLVSNVQNIVKIDPSSELKMVCLYQSPSREEWYMSTCAYSARNQWTNAYHKPADMEIPVE